MKSFQISVVVLGAVMAVVEHHQAQEPKEAIPKAIAFVEAQGQSRESAESVNAADVFDLGEMDEYMGDDAAIENEETGTAASIALPVRKTEVSNVQSKSALAFLLIREPVLLTSCVKLASERRLSKDDQVALKMPFSEATSVQRVPTVFFGKQSQAPLDLFSFRFDRGLSEDSKVRFAEKNRPFQVALSVGALKQSVAGHLNVQLTTRTEVGCVFGSTVGGMQTNGHGWDVNSQLTVDASGNYKWWGLTFNHRPFNMGDLGEHIRVQLGLYAGRNWMQLTSRNSGDTLEGSWKSRSSVYLGMGYDVHLSARFSLMADAGALAIAQPSIRSGTPSLEMVDVVTAVEGFHFFPQARLGLGWRF